MFIIKPENPADWQHALFILSYYHVNGVMYSDGEEAESVYMVVSGNHVQEQTTVYPDGTVALEEDEDSLRLAEMAFQMNWRQENNMPCVHCEAQICGNCDREEGEGECPLTDHVCGHLTFVKPINPAF